MVLKKISNIFELMKPSKKEKHRTLVLVGSHGEVISIKRFMGLTILTTFVSIITIVIIIYLLFASSRLRRENMDFKEALNEYELKIKHLKNENDILMARLVAGSEGEGTAFDAPESTEKSSSRKQNVLISFLSFK